MSAYHELTAMSKLKYELENRMNSLKSGPQTRGYKLTINKIKEGLKWIETETKRIETEQKEKEENPQKENITKDNYTFDEYIIPT